MDCPEASGHLKGPLPRAQLRFHFRVSGRCILVCSYVDMNNADGCAYSRFSVVVGYGPRRTNGYAAARLGVSAKFERRSASSAQLWPCEVISHLDRVHAGLGSPKGVPVRDWITPAVSVVSFRGENAMQR